MVKIVAVAGMPGSGKSVVDKAASQAGIPVLIMGDVVREEAERRGVPRTTENLARLAALLRENEGKDVVARRVAEKIVKGGYRKVVVDGVRSLEEVSVLREVGDVVVVAVHASPRTRFSRLRRRGRGDDPRTWDEFVLRDMTELEFGLGKVIALADYMIVNEGCYEDALNAAKKVLRVVFGENNS